MSASIYCYWPGSSEEEQESHPGFRKDDHAYACWITDILSNWWLAWRMRRNGFEALLSVHSLDTPDDEIEWTTPDRLRKASSGLKARLAKGDRFSNSLIKLYTKGPGVDEPRKELAVDLSDVWQIAEYAQKRGAEKLALIICF